MLARLAHVGERTWLPAHVQDSAWFCPQPCMATCSQAEPKLVQTECAGGAGSGIDSSSNCKAGWRTLQVAGNLLKRARQLLGARHLGPQASLDPSHLREACRLPGSCLLAQAVLSGQIRTLLSFRALPSQRLSLQRSHMPLAHPAWTVRPAWPPSTCSEVLAQSHASLSSKLATIATPGCQPRLLVDAGQCSCPAPDAAAHAQPVQVCLPGQRQLGCCVILRARVSADSLCISGALRCHHGCAGCAGCRRCTHQGINHALLLQQQLCLLLQGAVQGSQLLAYAAAVCPGGQAVLQEA